MKRMRLVMLLATAVILLQSAGGFCQKTPWDITLTMFTAASDKVVLKRVETYFEESNSSVGYLEGEIANNTQYDIASAFFSTYLKDSAGNLSLAVGGNNGIAGEDVIILGDGTIVTDVIKSGKSGYFRTWLDSDTKTYSIVMQYRTVSPHIPGDIDDDGDVDFDDFFILADNFGKTAATAAAKVATGK